MQTRSDIRLISETTRALGRDIADHEERLQCIENALNDPAKARLIDQAADRVSDAHTEEQVRAIGELVAFGIGPSATATHTDRAQLLVDLLGRLQPDHLTVLKTIGDPKGVGGPTVSVGHNGVLPAALDKLLPNLSGVKGPLASWLNALGLIDNVGTGRVGGIGDQVEWSPTAFGRQIVEFLVRPAS